MNRTLPQVCRKCRKLKMPDLGRFVHHRGSNTAYFICAHCDAKPKFTRGRARKATPDEAEARRALLGLALPFHQEYAVGPFWFDFAIPALKLLIEVDSYTYHHRPWQRKRDAAKQSLAESKSWRVVRVRRPDVAAKVRAAVELWQQELTQLPPGNTATELPD